MSEYRSGESDPAPVRFTIKDSGERAQFASGMIRDTTAGKIDWHRCADGPLMRRYASHLTQGAIKYPDLPDGRPNWMLANGVAEWLRFRVSAFRHFIQWFMGFKDEDHFAATVFNMNGKEYCEERLGYDPQQIKTPSSS